jgi:DNA-binding HxlR family transcriptional regulator
MNKYGQYCPAARAVEILGDRWTLLIVRDLLCGVQHFNELERGLPGISKALLAQRLKRLQQTGIIERQVEPDGRKSSYHLTPAGLELKTVIDVLVHWGAKWAFGEPERAELNPILLLWWMRAGTNAERLPPHRVVVEFDFREARPDRYWLVLTQADVAVCIKHPGFESDMLVTADLAAFYQVWLGRMGFSEALRTQMIRLDSTPALSRAFPSWFALSPAAEVVQVNAQNHLPHSRAIARS